MDYGLKGKVAIVTGGGGAIGGATAGSLAAEGAAVAIWDLDGGAASVMQDRIMADGGWACAVACDVTMPASVRGALGQTLEEFGRVDILVNGAGGNRSAATTSADRPFFDIDPAELQGVVDLNYTSTVLVCQAVARVFAAQGAGAIVNIASIAGIRPLTRTSAYNAGKAATLSFTQWLAVHLAREYSPGIRVNAVAPGFVLTDQNRFLLVGPDGGTTERGARILDHVPAGRYGEPEEVASAILWLASAASRFVTGAVVPVDGGFTAYPGV